MATLTVPCPHCSRGTRVDSARLPDGPASFACPHCRAKVVVDKRQLLSRQSPQAAATEPPAQPAAATSAPAAGPKDAPAQADRRFARLPADATFPSGIILGEDEAVIRDVQEKLAELGSDVERVSSAEVARELIVNEQPDLCIYVAGNIAAPPYAPIEPLTGLPPSFRRRLYLALISDNLKTLDGNAAFLYQVNMILWKGDLRHLGPALYSGVDYHNRLYQSFFEAVQAKGSI